MRQYPSVHQKNVTSKQFIQHEALFKIHYDSRKPHK